MKKTFLFFLILILPFGAVSMAEESIQAKVTILTTRPAINDPRIPPEYLKQLKKFFPHKYFEQAGESILTLTKAQRVKQLLPGDYELMLTLQGRTASMASVQALIRKGSQSYVDTVLAIENKGIVILGGPPAEEKILIIVVETGF